MCISDTSLIDEFQVDIDFLALRNSQILRLTNRTMSIKE